MRTFTESLKLRQGDVKPAAKIMANQHIEKGNFKKTLDLLKHIGKKVKVDKSTEGTSKAIWTIEGTMNEMKLPISDEMFKSLKKGDKIKIGFDSSIKKGNENTYVVVSKTKSAKYNLEKIKLKNVANPVAQASFLYNRQGKVTMAQGDMAVTMNTAVKESVEEASILKTVHKNVTNKKSAEKDRKKAVKTMKDIRKGKYAGVKMANEDVVLEEAMLNEFSDAQLAQLKKAYANLDRINPTSPTYKKLKAMIAKMDVKALEKIARAKVKFVSQIAAREYEVKSGNRLKAKDYMESTELEEKGKGLWYNIRKKRERGEPKAKPGDKDYPKTLNIESTELDEAVNVKGIQKAVDAGKSMDAIMTMFANKRTTNTDEIRKVVKDYMWKKRMKKEEVELDEAIDFRKAFMDIQSYAKKSGGMDKTDFEKVAYYVKAIGDNQNTPNVANKAFMAMKKHIAGLDTDVRDGIHVLLKKHGMVKNGRMVQESVELDEAIGKLGPNASREDKIKHTMKIMKMYPANKGKSEKELRKGATDYIDQFTNKNKRDDAYIAKMKAKKESVDEAKTGLPTGQSTVDYENSIQKLMKTLKKDSKNKGKSGNELRKLATFKMTGHKLKESKSIDEASKEGTVRIIDLGNKGQDKIRKELGVDKLPNKGFQVQVMTKGKFVNQGKPYKTMKDAEKVRSTGQHSMQFDEATLEEKTKWKMGDGRPRNGAHIENDRFWNLPMDSLKYIQKDAHAAMKANPNGRKAGKYADEVNDAATVMAWRKKNGIKESVEKKTFWDLR